MARVVVRQKNIPYGLIVFVFLFVVASVFAVFFYMHDDGKATRITELEKTEQDLNDDIENLNSQVATLAGYVSGAETFAKANADYKAILPSETEGDEDLLKYDPDLKLIDNLREFRRQINLQTDRADELLARADYQELDLAGQLQKERDRRIAMATVAAERDQQIALLMTAQQAERTELARQLADAREQFASIRKDLERENDVLATDLAHEKDTVRELEERVDTLRIEIASIRQPHLAEPYSINIDGEITRVVDENICYINLGTGNGVLPDQIFSVYSAAGQEEGPKAQIIVKQTFEETSECVVTSLLDPKNPIAPGDIIDCIAFDENHIYTFVVRGRFDIEGGRNPTAEGRDQVIALIRQFGGRVVDDVDVDVDFVVLGPEPAIPPEPDEDMPATIRDIYEARLRERQEYQDVKREAVHLRLRILNTNRFLERVGYVPIKRLTYEEHY